VQHLAPPSCLRKALFFAKHKLVLSTFDSSAFQTLDFNPKLFSAGLPDFSWYNTTEREICIYQNGGKIFQMATKYTKLPQNIPNGHKIYQRQQPLVPLLLLGSPFFPIILFGSTTLLIRMTGISLHMQWPLTSQPLGSVSQREQLDFSLRIKLHAT
jgi:hypothetical protein